jgi:hypothetical protein
MDAESMRRISDQCLRGRPVPRSLAALWDAADGGESLWERFRIECLLRDLAPLDAGYGEAIARESEGAAASIRAHREIFQQLGFFAESQNGGFLAFWLRDESPEPVVLELDDEGQYAWRGENLAEVLVRRVEDDPEGARTWLAERGVELGALGELGASTQFLPDPQKLHEELFRAARGEERRRREPARNPASPNDFSSWLLRPGPEVKSAIERRLGAPCRHFCAWCGADGLVDSMRFDKRLDPGPVLGIALGAPRTSVTAALGEPEKAMGWWARYSREGRRFRFAFDDNGMVKEITVAVE